jgi:hypothetical protein
MRVVPAAEYRIYGIGFRTFRARRRGEKVESGAGGLMLDVISGHSGQVVLWQEGGVGRIIIDFWI